MDPHHLRAPEKLVVWQTILLPKDTRILYVCKFLLCSVCIVMCGLSLGRAFDLFPIPGVIYECIFTGAANNP